mgnify:FL=1
MKNSKCLTTEAREPVRVARDGKYIVTAGVGGVVIWWDTQKFNPQAAERLIKNYKFLGLSEDKKYIALSPENRTVKIFEVHTSKCIATLEDHNGDINSVSFSIDGKFVASASDDKTVKIWEMHTSKCIATLEDHTERVRSVSFSIDGRFVASASGDKTVKIWEVPTSKCIETLKGHLFEATSVSFSGDGKYIASGSDDRTVRIWVNKNGKWYCDKIFSAYEVPLSALRAKVEQVRVSKRNKALLKQLVGKDEMNSKESAPNNKGNENKDEKSDETNGEMKHNPTFAREAANEISLQFWRNNRIRLEELTKQSNQKETLKSEAIHISVAKQKDNIQKKEKAEVAEKRTTYAQGQENPQRKKNACCMIF